MYYKAKLFNDEECAKAIMNTNDPKAMKRLANEIKSFNSTQWQRVSLQVNIR